MQRSCVIVAPLWLSIPIGSYYAIPLDHSGFCIFFQYREPLATVHHLRAISWELLCVCTCAMNSFFKAVHILIADTA